MFRSPTDMKNVSECVPSVYPSSHPPKPMWALAFQTRLIHPMTNAIAQHVPPQFLTSTFRVFLIVHVFRVFCAAIIFILMYYDYLQRKKHKLTRLGRQWWWFGWKCESVRTSWKSDWSDAASCNAGAILPSTDTPVKWIFLLSTHADVHLRARITFRDHMFAKLAVAKRRLRSTSTSVNGRFTAAQKQIVWTVFNLIGLERKTTTTMKIRMISFFYSGDISVSLEPIDWPFVYNGYLHGLPRYILQCIFASLVEYISSP